MLQEYLAANRIKIARTFSQSDTSTVYEACRCKMNHNKLSRLIMTHLL